MFIPCYGHLWFERARAHQGQQRCTHGTLVFLLAVCMWGTQRLPCWHRTWAPRCQNKTVCHNLKLARNVFPAAATERFSWASNHRSALTLAHVTWSKSIRVVCAWGALPAVNNAAALYARTANISVMNRTRRLHLMTCLKMQFYYQHIALSVDLFCC